MKTRFIAINVGIGQYGKDDSPTQALRLAYVTGKLNVSKNLKQVRLLECQYPVPETDKDDVTFYQDGGYTIKGNVIVFHYDEGEIAHFMEFDYEED